MPLFVDYIGDGSRHAHAFAILIGNNALGVAAPAADVVSGIGAVFLAVVAPTADFVIRNVVTSSDGRHRQILGPLAIGMITDRTGSVPAGPFIGATPIMVGAALSLQRDAKN